MKDILIKNILHGMVGTLDSRELEILKDVLQRNLKQFAITENKDVDEQNKIENSRYLTMFISAKQVEGCSSKTLNYYQTTIEKLLSSTNKWIKDITTDDLREYLSTFQRKNNARLIKILSLYRLTLGQARQEELLEYIFDNCENPEEMKDLFINLSPYYKSLGGTENG